MVVSQVWVGRCDCAQFYKSSGQGLEIAGKWKLELETSDEWRSSGVGIGTTPVLAWHPIAS